MSGEKQKPTCPHCGAKLRALALPDGTGWSEPFHLVCFNDECPYFVRGWAWMEQNYAQKKSYRYRVNPSTGLASPLAVWSVEAMKDHLLGEDDAGV